jgi:adenine-specific DNA glycosylase
MIEVYHEFQEFPHSLMEIAAAIQKRAAACSPDKAPLNPAISTVLTQLAAAVHAAAVSSQQLETALVALHPELKRLTNPRAAEGMWDTVNN